MLGERLLYGPGRPAESWTIDVYKRQMFVAVKGKGAFLNGKPIHVSEAKTLSESLVTIGTSPYYHELADWIFKVFKEVFLSCQDIRHLGSAALDMAYVACGKMCIRDRAYTDPYVLRYIPCTGSYEPVSYTHLDVYKRQRTS